MNFVSAVCCTTLQHVAKLCGCASCHVSGQQELLVARTVNSSYLPCASVIYFCCLLDAFRKPLPHKNETTGCVLAVMFQNCSCDFVESLDYCPNILLIVNDFVEVVPANLFSGGAFWPILGRATSVSFVLSVLYKAKNVLYHGLEPITSCV